MNTCTLDGAAALPNYLARGFVRVRAETYWVDLPRPAAPPAAPQRRARQVHEFCIAQDA